MLTNSVFVSHFRVTVKLAITSEKSHSSCTDKHEPRKRIKAILLN